MGMFLSWGIFMFWVTGYPDGSDPKNIDYVLWTHGLNKNMNLDDAVGTMTHDVWSERLVVGLSKEQLKGRFGYIRTFNEARPYDQSCYTTGGTVGELGVRPDGKEAVYLRDSDYMVLLDKDIAVDLVLCKGF